MSRAIRILHVIDHLGYGGAPIVVRRLIEGLRRPEFELTVCSLRASAKTISLAAPVVNLGSARYSPSTPLSLARLCRSRGIDIVHAHLPKASFSALLAGRRLGARVIVHEHGPILCGWFRWPYAALLRLLVSSDTVLLANSEAAQRALSRAVGRNDRDVVMVHNFVEARRFDASRYDRAAVRRTLGIAEQHRVVGFVGRLDYYKGADRLVAAAGRLCRADDRYRLVLVGQGAQKDSLCRQVRKLGIEGRVIFAGLWENPAEIMCAFDVAVVPSRSEAFGLVAIECMLLGIPVVASAVGGLPELVQDGQTGLLLERADAAEIAAAVNRLMEDKALRETVIRNAAPFAQRFDGKEQLEQIADLYKRLGMEW